MQIVYIFHCDSNAPSTFKTYLKSYALKILAKSSSQ